MEMHVETLRTAQANFLRLSRKPATIDEYNVEVSHWKDHIVDFKGAARRAQAVLRSDRPKDACKQNGSAGKGKKRKRAAKRGSLSSSSSDSDA